MKKTPYRIANAPCSWGIQDNETNHRIGFGQLLDELKAAGYTGTELGGWGFMPTEANALHRELKQRDLAMVGAFVQVTLAEEGAHKGGIATAVKTAQLLAACHQLQPDAPPPRIVLSDTINASENRLQRAGRIRTEDGLTPKQWDTFAAGANRVAKEVLERTGIKTVFHHHCAAFIETPAEVSTLMERTDPKLLGLCLDSGHFTVGGGVEKPADAVQALKHYGDRVWHVHFKDCQPKVTELRDGSGKVTGHRSYTEALGEALFCEMGKGVCAFPALIEELNRRNYQGWVVVEQDVLPGMGDPKESARRNRQYLESLGV